MPRTNVSTIVSVIDDNGVSDPESDLCYHWTSWSESFGSESFGSESFGSESSGRISVPRLLDSRESHYRNEYLRFIAEIGKTVASRLSLPNRPGSLWHLSSLADKSSYERAYPYEVLKLWALEDKLSRVNVSELKLYSSNRQLAAALSSYCRISGIPFQWNPSKVRLPKLQQLAALLKHPFQAAAFLPHRWWTRARFLRKVRSTPLTEKSSIIFSYFPNLDSELASKGIFNSHYWNEAKSLFQELSESILWVLLYVPNREYSYQEASALVEKFNRQSEGNESFMLLEEAFGIHLALRTVWIFLRALFTTSKLTPFKRFFKSTKRSDSAYPFLQAECWSSFCGKTLIEGIYYRELFAKLLRSIPNPQRAIYLWENCPWERELLAEWRDTHHAPILGYQHASVAINDLRSFNDPMVYQGNENERFPLPDRLICNSPIIRKRFLDSGIPAECLGLAEAQRFRHLRGRYNVLLKTVPDSQRSLLVICDAVRSAAELQCRMLAEADKIEGLQAYSRIIFKSHPFCPIDPPDLSCEVRVSVEPLQQFWTECNVVLCANSSTAALEAAWLGIPTIVFAAVGSLNLSPLCETAKTIFVHDYLELASALKHPNHIKIPENYFLLDETYSAWRRLLIAQAP